MESVLPTLMNPSTETSASEFRRSKARHILINKVTDRSIKGAVKWNRSVNEVQINNYKNECRKAGAHSVFQRHNMLSSGLCRKEEIGNPESLTMSYSYFTPGIGKKDNKSIKNPYYDLGYGLQREMSLTEIHQIMQEHGKSDDLALPKISINIHRTMQGNSSNPEVKLMLRKLPPPEFQLRRSHLPQKPPTPFSQLRSQTFGPSDFQHYKPEQQLQTPNGKRRESVGVASDRGKLNSLAMSPYRHLQKLERDKMTSRERAKVWLEHNPLGPESAPADLEDESMQYLKRIAPLQPLKAQAHDDDNSTTPSTTAGESDRPKTVAIEISKPVPLAPKLKQFPKSAGSTLKKTKNPDNPPESRGKKVRFGTNSWMQADDEYIFRA